MPDTGLNFGYNVTSNGGRRNTTDAAWRLGFETNYLGNVGSIGLDFEFHMPELIAFDGRPYRLNSYYTEKTNGVTRNERYIDTTQFFSNQDHAVYPGPQYLQIAAGNNIGFGCAPVITMQGSGLLAAYVAAFDMIDDSTGDQLHWRLLPGGVGQIAFNVTDIIDFYKTGEVFVCRSGGVFAVGTGPLPPDPSAIVQVYSTTQGILFPQMTTVQKLAIVAPTEGLTVYDLTLHQISYWNLTTWINL